MFIFYSGYSEMYDWLQNLIKRCASVHIRKSFGSTREEQSANHLSSFSVGGRGPSSAASWSLHVSQEVDLDINCVSRWNDMSLFNWFLFYPLRSFIFTQNVSVYVKEELCLILFWVFAVKRCSTIGMFQKVNTSFVIWKSLYSHSSCWYILINEVKPEKGAFYNCCNCQMCFLK